MFFYYTKYHMRIFLILSFLLAMILGYAAYGQPTTNLRVALRNPSAMQTYDGLTAIPWQLIIQSWPGIDSANLTILCGLKQEIPYQYEYLGTGKIVNLLVQVKIEGGAKMELLLQAGKPMAIKKATYCRYVPERYEDFAWENDKIAFRAYGKALENTMENAWGIDVWSKRTSNLVINSWYKTADYHKDNGEGLDYYKVGFTLGAGGIAAMYADTLCYASNYIRWEVLDNGPLRSRFRLFHAPFMAGKAEVSMVREIWIDAGSQLFTNRVTVHVKDADSVDLAVGIRKNTGTEGILLDETNQIMAYWNPEEPPHGTIGIGCIFGTGTKRQLTNDKHLLAITRVAHGTSFEYRTGAVWDKAGHITSFNLWIKYLMQQKESSVPEVVF
jgi:hypothetical protein